MDSASPIFKSSGMVFLLMYKSSPVLALKAKATSFFVRIKWALPSFQPPVLQVQGDTREGWDNAIKFPAIVSGEICSNTKAQAVYIKVSAEKHLFKSRLGDPWPFPPERSEFHHVWSHHIGCLSQQSFRMPLCIYVVPNKCLWNELLNRYSECRLKVTNSKYSLFHVVR